MADTNERAAGAQRKSGLSRRQFLAGIGGLGIGVVPDYVVHDDIARGDLLPALPQWRLSIFGRAMYMLYMPNRHHPRAISMMIEFIQQRAQAAHEGRPGLLGAA